MLKRLEKGSLILVTGANGYIASHVIDQFLAQDYVVRGTVRNIEANKWLQDYFDQKHGAGKLTLVKVEDFGKDGCFDEAVKGVDSFVHIASDLSFSPDPNVIVTYAIDATERALKAAASEPSVKTFVLTSSSTAATLPKPNTKFHIDKDTWNTESITNAWAPPPYEQERAWDVYGASKAQAEQAAWKFVKEQKPKFSFNSVLPNANFGPVLDPAKQHGSTASWVRRIYDNPEAWMAIISKIKPQYYVHPTDTARLHVSAATDPSIQNERIFAFAEPFNWNQVLKIARQARPGVPTPENIDNDEHDLSTVDTTCAVKLLKSHFQQDGFLSLEKGVRDVLESCYRG